MASDPDSDETTGTAEPTDAHGHDDGSGQNAETNAPPPAAGGTYSKSVRQNAPSPNSAGEQDAEWATQDEYEQRTAETTDVVVPRGGMKFRVTQESPMKFASLVEKHGLNDLRGAMDSGGRDGFRDVPDVAMDDTGMDSVIQTVTAFREIVVPNVVRPSQAYWDEPPAEVDPSDREAFDLSRLHEEDLVTLVAGVTGQDPETMIEDAEDAAGTATDGGTATEDGEYDGRFRG